MSTRRFSRCIARQWKGWCALLLLVSALQPFLSVHFDVDGLVERQELSIRAFGQDAQFQPDEDGPGPSAVEVKLFVPSAASIDLPLAFISGLAAFLCLVILAAPLRVVLAAFLGVFDSTEAAPVPNAGGAPPSTQLWRTRPPETAPPR
ncbi:MULTISPECIES: hypothetical protein [unclassified Variovorax]|uniref:hypothetical protein n=1 Tax=unclassified Variovorax TaxID=663243 RepID=UPI001BD4FE76|nr:MULTISPECIES: hypothetical protein [unclassified Variovorax]